VLRQAPQSLTPSPVIQAAQAQHRCGNRPYTLCGKGRDADGYEQQNRRSNQTDASLPCCCTPPADHSNPGSKSHALEKPAPTRLSLEEMHRKTKSPQKTVWPVANETGLYDGSRPAWFVSKQQPCSTGSHLSATPTSAGRYELSGKRSPFTTAFTLHFLWTIHDRFQKRSFVRQYSC
jgi:hypothetical protein